MSILKDLKGVLFSNLRHDMPLPIRKACSELYDAVDNDLDVASYYPSSTTEESLERFEAILVNGDEELPNDFDISVSDDDEVEPDDSDEDFILDDDEIE